ncbi:glutathione S-transferase [Bradyrhizobium sp. CB1717]|uniref:Glutathione S-transferase n=1 Tax=Bradyrhizobium forestalis TaxID=1419263 RepID=A0A2M8R763_9BRAD|nr:MULTISPECIES: glutathione S-transferase [Bradyrhizobium]PJG53666.1 glutathione S-transferase [Bradyrhizobium forestalis]WFU23243.1 glutathione S-transferase [Bradyrhizobium sp. CB1717]
MNQQIRLYGGKLSGHSHRVELFLRLLDLPFEFAATPPPDRKTPTFLAMNAFGEIPVIDDNGIIIADSNAILVYLATRYDASRTWLPVEAVELAQVQRWLSVAAGPLAFGPATARLGAVFGRSIDRERSSEIADRLFKVMNEHLAQREFVATDVPTVADVACYSYTRAAPEGGVALQPYPNIVRWLERIEALPRFEPMPPAPR